MSTNKVTQKTMRQLAEAAGQELSLGGFLWAIREGEEMSQATFGDLLGVSRQYICDLEYGRRFVSPKAAAEYAKILGYSQEQFIRLCLQDLMIREGIVAEVKIKLQKVKKGA